MNIHPLTSDQRNFAIARLGEGLTARAVDTMHWTLSDGHVRSCYEGLFGEPVPADPSTPHPQSFSPVAAEKEEGKVAA